MIEETLGNYRFSLDQKYFLIETPASIFQKALLLEGQWVLDETGEIFHTLRDLWNYMSHCISDLRTILWKQERCDEYFSFIDDRFRQYISELEIQNQNPERVN